MNARSWEVAEQLIPKSYIKQAADAKRTRESLIQQLLEHKKWPQNGWDDSTIEILLSQLSLMDSNNFLSNCGLGEREARFASKLVARRHFHFGHGIGRSGDLTEPQPKAAGSSLMQKITNSLLHDVINFMGVKCADCLLVPVATGMSLVLCMLAIRQHRKEAEYVIWSRIDQKACFKSILTAGLKPVIIDTIFLNDELVTDVNEIERQILLLTPEKIVCVMTTTSCFAPRACDSVEEVAEICNKHKVPHLINNAYGLQTTTSMHRIQQAAKKGRVDLFVQSTDKNLLVPVGGSIVAGFEKELVTDVSKIYPGRASASPVIDVFITLLSLGQHGYSELIRSRKEKFKYLREQLHLLTRVSVGRLLNTPHNPISLALSLTGLKQENITQLGSMLFLRNISGTRVITGKEIRKIGEYEFNGWGSHCSSYPRPYLTAAAAIGVTDDDIDVFIKKLHKCLIKLKTGNGDELGNESLE